MFVSCFGSHPLQNLETSKNYPETIGNLVPRFGNTHLTPKFDWVFNMRNTDSLKSKKLQ